MNLRDLHYLVAVADLHSFVQAAERCCISQPTLSMQIKKLEEELGVQLFERTNKVVISTAVGEDIIAAARRIVQETESIKQIAKTAKDPYSGNLRLGAIPTLSTYIFAPLVPLIKAQLPRIRLILIEEKTDQLLQQLKQGTLDIALLALPIADDFLESCHLFDDPFFLAVAEDHEFAAKTSVDLAELYGHALLLLDEGHCLRGQALSVCQISGAQEQQDLRATGLETLRQMVHAGTGMTFIPKIAKRSNDGICYIPFTAPAPQRSIGLVWRKTSARQKLFSELSVLISSLVI